jgi:hypothetical protein
MGEIFENQIFCANVHNGKVNRAPSSPIIGHVQILKCLETRLFGPVYEPMLYNFKNFRQRFAE